MKKICMFVIITFLLTWSLIFGLIFTGKVQGQFITTIFALSMLMPAISVIITTIVTKEKFKDVWIKPNFKGNIKYYLIAWFSPALLIILGALVYYLVFPNHFDGNMTNIIATLKEQLTALGQSIPSDSQLKLTFIIQIFTALLIAPLLNFITCLGEELGWRGYLLPNLCKKYSPLVSTIISGIIWGIWHAPMIALGHNYGLDYPSAPWGGILAMIVFCIVVGALFSYVTLKTRSSIPATLAHGMLNGFASTGTIFLATTAINPFLGPIPVGIIGGIGFIIVGVICLLLISKMNLKDTL